MTVASIYPLGPVCHFTLGPSFDMLKSRSDELVERRLQQAEARGGESLWTTIDVVRAD